MKTTSNSENIRHQTIVRHAGRVLLAVMLALTASAGRAQVVFNNLQDNTTNADPTLTGGATTYFSDTVEFGDEIMLRPAQGAVLTNFAIQFFATNLPAFGATMELKIYANDGAKYGTDFRVPGTVLYDSDIFPLYGATANGTHTLTFDKASAGLDLYVPANFTWTVQIAGLTDGASAGLVEYDPTSAPLIGTDYAGYWEASGNGWLYRTNAGAGDINFGAEAVAVTVTNIPLVNPQKIANGGFGFEFFNQPNRNFSVITTTNLADPIYKWVNLGSATENASGHYIFYDARATNNTMGFYQVLKD